MATACILLRIVGVLFALSFVRSSGSSSSSDAQHYAQLSGSPSVRSVCRAIPSTFSLCHGVGYRQMRVPNLLEHSSLREAQQQSAAWLPLVSKLCHRDTKKFLCSLFAPVCLAELSGAVMPCRALCEAVRDGCVPVMNAFGFPWPDMFNCSRFPQGTDLCIPQTGDTEETRTAQEAATHEEEANKGTVICDACSLAAEGETDIQDNFCQSPYAFKLRLGSVSVVGGDRQLVPLGRSRILRWAGGGAERAEGVGGAMAHNALWLPEGGACVCPGLDDIMGEDGGGGAAEEGAAATEERRRRNSGRKEEGGKEGKAAPVAGGWFLGLAKADEGRLVLSRLVRWTREDKELKKFIRALLRQSCSLL